MLLTTDRNVKENFTTINARDVLAKVAAGLPGAGNRWARSFAAASRMWS